MCLRNLAGVVSVDSSSHEEIIGTDDVVFWIFHGFFDDLLGERTFATSRQASHDDANAIASVYSVYNALEVRWQML